MVGISDIFRQIVRELGEQAEAAQRRQADRAPEGSRADKERFRKQARNAWGHAGEPFTPIQWPTNWWEEHQPKGLAASERTRWGDLGSAVNRFRSDARRAAPSSSFYERTRWRRDERLKRSIERAAMLVEETRDPSEDRLNGVVYDVEELARRRSEALRALAREVDQLLSLHVRDNAEEGAIERSVRHNQEDLRGQLDVLAARIAETQSALSAPFPFDCDREWETAIAELNKGAAAIQPLVAAEREFARQRISEFERDMRARIERS